MVAEERMNPELLWQRLSSLIFIT